MTELTYKVIASFDIKSFNSDEYIDWACEMIGEGYETPNLLILSGFDKPTNFFEISEIFKKTIEELGLYIPRADSSILSYSYYLIYLLSMGKSIRENLSKIYQLSFNLIEDSPIYDFKLLYWAWGDLDYNEDGTQHYWEGATISNINDIIIEAAQKWLNENASSYRIENIK